jgi:hypothetical protein
MSVDGRNWNAFVILDAGGNAMRWARRAFHEDKYSYEQIVQRAQSAPDRFRSVAPRLVVPIPLEIIIA